MSFRAGAPGLQTPQRHTVGARPAIAGAAAKTTPTKAAPSTPTATDSPGNWRHPRMDEITRRRAATVFTEANLKTFVYNSVALVVFFLAAHATGAPFKQLHRLVVPPQHSALLVLLVNAVLVLNMARSLLPLFRKPDTLSDIPLTPSQRKLLGLPALRASATPNAGAAAAGYTTPPRYARTPSVSGSAASIATATRGSASGNDASFSKSFTGSPISASPLFPKARNGNGSGGGSGGGGSPFSPSSPFQSARKASFGSPSALPGAAAGGAASASLFNDSTLAGLPGTPSPTSKRLSMGLNNKWLYEKGRRSSSGTRIY